MAHRGLGLKGGPAQRQRRRGPAAVLDVVVVDVVDAMVPRGQRGPGVAGGEGNRRRSLSPVMRPWRSSNGGAALGKVLGKKNWMGIGFKGCRAR